MHVYLREAPRALILVSSSALDSAPGKAFALVISTPSNASPNGFVRKAGATSSRDAAPRAKVAAELVDLEEISISSMRRLTQIPAAGCLGIMNIGAGEQLLPALESDCLRTSADI